MPRSTRIALTPRDRARLTERASPKLDAAGPVGFHFSPERHGLSAAQCLQATKALRHLEVTRPIRDGGARGNALRALRIAGVVSSVRGGRIGARGWGKRMLATKGGNAMKAHALAHLRQWGPVARLAARLAYERRQAARYYETHGEVLPIGTEPPATMEAQRVSDLITAWETHAWQTQQAAHLKW